MPDKAPPEATDFSAGPKQVDGAIVEAQVSDEQLARSNEPEFTGALQDKKDGRGALGDGARPAPGERGADAGYRQGGRGQATGTVAMASMGLSRRVAGAVGDGGQAGGEGQRRESPRQGDGDLQKVFDATKTEVETILNGIDDKVSTPFDTGEKAARDAFTASTSRRWRTTRTGATPASEARPAGSATSSPVCPPRPTRSSSRPGRATSRG